MNCEQVRLSFLDDAPAPEVEEHLSGCAACREIADEIAGTRSLLERLEPEPSSERMRSRFQEMMAAHADGRAAGRDDSRPEPAGLRWWVTWLAPRLGPALATLAIGLWIGGSLGGGSADKKDIEDLQARLRSMEQTLSLSLLENRSASERLRAVDMNKNASPDAEMIHALLRVIDRDPSANVRLAALDVLAGVTQRNEVREGLLEAFPRQDSPTVVAAMADVLLATGDPRSLAEVRKTAESERLPDSVRDYLREAVGRKGKGI